VEHETEGLGAVLGDRAELGLVGIRVVIAFLPAMRLGALQHIRTPALLITEHIAIGLPELTLPLGVLKGPRVPSEVLRVVRVHAALPIVLSTIRTPHSLELEDHELPTKRPEMETVDLDFLLTMGEGAVDPVLASGQLVGVIGAELHLVAVYVVELFDLVVGLTAQVSLLALAEAARTQLLRVLELVRLSSPVYLQTVVEHALLHVMLILVLLALLHLERDQVKPNHTSALMHTILLLLSWSRLVFLNTVGLSLTNQGGESSPLIFILTLALDLVVHGRRLSQIGESLV
jgi:hypothetical protein